MPLCPIRVTGRTLAPPVLPAALALALTATPGQADVVSNLYANSSVYNYKINHMPDLDQNRTGLPNTGGMYCAPTSAINLFAYAANHGYTTSGLPNWNYQLNSHYDDVTDAIAEMGDLMNTSASGGTTCCVGSALDSWDNSNGLLKYTTKYLNSDYKPGVSSVAKKGCQGWIVSFAYGKYESIGDFQGNPIYQRTGGHVVTLQRAYRGGSTWIVRYRDPNDDSNLTSQSAFVNKRRDPFGVTGYFPNSGLRTLAGLFYSGGKVRCLDSYFAIRPIYGIAFSSSNFVGGGGTFEVIDPVPFEGSNDATLPSFSLPSNLLLHDLHLNVGEEGDALVITQATGLAVSKLRTLNLSTGELITLPNAPSGLKKIDVNRMDQIFAIGLGGKTLQLSADGTELSSTTAAVDPTDVTVNDADDFVWILSVPNRKIYKSSPDFSRFELIMSVPANVPMSGDGTIVVDPNTGVPYIKTDGSTKFWRILPPTRASGPIATAMPLPGVGVIQSLFMGEDGRLYVSDGANDAGGAGGTLNVFRIDGEGAWIPDLSSPMHGQPGGERVAILRSTSNYDPDENSGPAWQNLLTADIGDDAPLSADCDGDLNSDELVDGADLGLLLAAWGTDSVYDLNQDNTVDGADLGLLLGMWGACP